jgi:hypothetical protein
MKTKYQENLLATALLGVLAFASAHAQQIPIPTTAAEVRGPDWGLRFTVTFLFPK